jgi:hypothetical protein
MKNRNREIAADATTCGKNTLDGLPTGVVRSDTPLWQLTVQEFVELLESVLRNHVSVPEGVARNPPRMVHGLDGLCEVIGCSKSTAMRLKKSGILDEAIVQTGRKIIINADKALDILSNIKM